MEHRVQTDHFIALPRPYVTLTLTFDLDVWPWHSIPGELWSWPTHVHTLKFKGSRFKR